MNNFAFVVGFFTSIVSTHCSCSWPRSQSKFQTKLGNTKQPGNQKWCRLVLNGTLVFERRNTVWLISAFLKVLSSGLKAFVGNMAFPKNGIFSFNNSRQDEYIWHHDIADIDIWITKKAAQGVAHSYEVVTPAALCWLSALPGIQSRSMKTWN